MGGGESQRDKERECREIEGVQNRANSMPSLGLA